mmetsp:Transcript_10971/g.12584  ORF Transcript_10971/g.12584 Transcript_10971/m.12584 type:complete len:438 (-) Transcript_10971:66-1379(-)
MGCSNSKVVKTEKQLESVASRSLRRDSLSGGLPVNFTDDEIKKKLVHEFPIYRVVLTGGPCAGKSTLLSMMQTKFSQRTGIKVYTVPEAATLLVGGGLEWSNMTSEKVVEYQLALLRVQVALEDQFFAVARASRQPAIIVSDRGTMDGRAYCTPDQFTEIMKRGGWNLETLRDERYDAVVHMVTAAIGAEGFYNFDNPARYENVEEAVEADEKLRQMYVGHPLLRVFDNSTTFDGKLERVMQFIGHVIGHEFPHNMTRRFVLSAPPLESEIPSSCAKARMTITILHNSNESEVMQVIKREQDNACLYFYNCIKRKREEKVAETDSAIDINDVSLIECEDSFPITRSEHRISAREYASLLLQRDPLRVDIVKDNVSFVFQNHYYEVATFVSPPWAAGKVTLYVDSEDSNESLQLPPFLKVARERKDGFASSFQIALRR